MSTETDDRTLDVREIDGPPFDEIMAALSALEAGERLRLVAAFEPVPLYDVLGAREFQYEVEQRDDDEWHVLIEAA